MNTFLKTLIFYQILIQIIARAQNVLPSGCQEAFRAQGLALHNQYRAMHGTPPLASSSSLDTSALSWANTMATTGNFVHSAYGENLWANSDDSVLTLAKCSQLATLCVSSWYSEISSYPYNAPGFYSATGHFTQLIWYSSTSLGMGLSWGKSFSGGSGRAFYCVAHYLPYGNDGRYNFATQVLPLLTSVTTTPTTQRSSSIITAVSTPSSSSNSRPTSLSTQSLSALCRDLSGYENVCSAFSTSQYGFCNSPSSFVGGLVFSKACPKSCKLCSAIATTLTTCKDSSSSCPYWISSCYLLASLNPHPCKATCKLC
jgi:glioma pathogenesis-related protein 2